MLISISALTYLVTSAVLVATFCIGKRLLFQNQVLPRVEDAPGVSTPANTSTPPRGRLWHSGSNIITSGSSCEPTHQQNAISGLKVKQYKMLTKLVVVIWLMHSITWLPYITLYLLSRITSYT
jgi:hypothetical protein